MQTNAAIGKQDEIGENFCLGRQAGRVWGAQSLPIRNL